VIDNSENQSADMPLDRDAIIAAVAEYISLCRSEVTGKSKTRFPNFAGFCRYLGVGVEALEDVFKGYPDSYGVLCAVFEDEALNSEISPTILTAYMKKWIGYEKNQKTQVCDGQLKIIFDHDIMEDGK
jgi:hypothetical protein